MFLTDSVTPDYYQGDVECIEAIESALGPDGYQGFLAGNVMKYIWRYKAKGGSLDLEKAQLYLDMLIRCQQGREEADGGESKQAQWRD